MGEEGGVCSKSAINRALFSSVFHKIRAKTIQNYLFIRVHNSKTVNSTFLLLFPLFNPLIELFNELSLCTFAIVKRREIL